MAELVPDAPKTPTKAPYRRPGGKRFTSEEFALALRLLTEVRPDGSKPSDREIARLMGCKPETIGTIRRTYADTTQEARQILRASAATAAKNWLAAEKIAASDGNHTPAKEHLVAVGAVAEKSTPGAGATVVVIGIGQGSIGPDPWQSVKTVAGDVIDLPKTS
jgi:hypothetical protein